MAYGNYLIRSRHGTTYYARIIVPRDLRSQFLERREIRKTLGTACKATAKRRAMAVWLAYQGIFDALREGKTLNDLPEHWGALAALSEAISARQPDVACENRDDASSDEEPDTTDGGLTLHYLSTTYHGHKLEADYGGHEEKEKAGIAALMDQIDSRMNKAPAAVLPEPALDLAAGPMLSELFEQFLREAQRDNREKSKLSMRQSFNVFQELMGDMPVSEFSKDIARDFGDKYAEYPVNRTKGKWAKMSLDELLAAERPLISATTFNNNIRRLSTFGSWLAKIDKLPSDPFSAITRAKESSGPRKIRSWSDEELRIWFQSEEYLQHRNSKTAAWKYWLPLLALYSGARIEELAALAPTDVGKVKGVLSYRIHAEDGRFVKNSNAWRHVPIHPHLVRLGFMEYVKSRKGCERLFTVTCYQGQWGKYASTRLGEMRQRLKIAPTFHGYRNTVIVALAAKAKVYHHVPLITGQSISGETWSYLEAADKSVLLPELKVLVETLDWSHVIDIPD